MDGRPTWTDFDEAGDYVVPNVLSPRDLVSGPDNMDETYAATHICSENKGADQQCVTSGVPLPLGSWERMHYFIVTLPGHSM